MQAVCVCVCVPACVCFMFNACVAIFRATLCIFYISCYKNQTYGVLASRSLCPPAVLVGTAQANKKMAAAAPPLLLLSVSQGNF